MNPAVLVLIGKLVPVLIELIDKNPQVVSDILKIVHSLIAANTVTTTPQTPKDQGPDFKFPPQPGFTS